MWLFLLSFKRGNSIPSMEIDTKLLCKSKHFLFWKTGNLIISWISSLSPTIITCLKNHPNNQLFNELGTIWKYNLGLPYLLERAPMLKRAPMRPPLKTKN